MNGTYYKFDKNLLTKEYQFVLTKRRVKNNVRFPLRPPEISYGKNRP